MLEASHAAVAALLFCSFTFLLLIGAPIMLALGGAALCAFLYLGLDLSILIERAFASLTSFPLMALPAFVLAGALMEAGGISVRLVRVAEACASGFPGGIAISTVLACLFFGSISGSGPATTAAVGMLMIPAMAKSGQTAAYAAAVAAVAGGIGIVMPPSVPMVIYGVAGQTSITRLFMAGIFPGILFGLALCICVFAGARSQGGRKDKNMLREALREGIWALFAPVLVLGGIYAGLFTPTEAAVAAIFYTIAVGRLIYHELSWHKLLLALNATSWLTGRVLILVFTASILGFILTLCRLPDALALWLLGITDNIWLIWLFVVILLLFLGMFMETLALIMLVTPVLLPMMQALGVDATHFGIILVCCCSLGFATPPLGENLFMASAISGVSLERIARAALPLLLPLLLAVFLLIIFPQLSLWLPDLLMK